MLPIEVFLILVVISIIIVVLIHHKGLEHENNKSDKNNGRITNKTGGSYLALPLKHENGFYQTEFTLSGNNTPGTSRKPFQAIPDTGSNILIVGSEKCEKCPKTHGVWNMKEGFNTSGGKIDKIRYAGGQESIYLPWQGYIKDNSGDVKSAEFGVIVKTHNHKNRHQNVMGLTPGKRSFLNSLGGEKKVFFDFHNGMLYINPDKDELDRLTSGKRKQTLKIYMPDKEVRYPLIKINSYKALDSRNNPINASGAMPIYAIFDTGTNSTVIPKQYMNTMLPKGSSIGRFTFEGTQGDETMDFLLNNIDKKDKDGVPGHVLAGNLPIASTILIGAGWFDGYSVLFDYGNSELTFFQ